jgi:Zn-finger nucleic acid-binding protein
MVALHRMTPMKFTVCLESGLLMTERRGVEIEFHPHCRGLWLERGELNNQIKRPMGQEMLGSEPRQPDSSHKDDEHASRHRSSVHDHRRKKPWISEMFG